MLLSIYILTVNCIFLILVVISMKERKTVIKEINDIVISMMKTGKQTINEIAQNLEIHRHTVRSIIAKEVRGFSFVTAGEKRRTKCKERNVILNNIEQTKYNAVACNDSHTQDEIKEIVQESGIASLSRSTISRKLKIMKITRKD